MAQGPAQRDVMEYDVADRRRRSRGTCHCDPAQAAQARAHRLRARKRLDHRRAYPCRARCSNPARWMRCCPSGATRRCPSRCRCCATSSCGSAAERRHPHAVDPQLPAQPRQLHRLAGRARAAGWPRRPKALGVDVFAGFAAALPLFDDDGSVAGVQIGDMGVQHDGSRGPNYTPGPEVRAPSHGRRRRLPRQPGQGAHRQVQARCATAIRRSMRWA